MECKRNLREVSGNPSTAILDVKMNRQPFSRDPPEVCGYRLDALIPRLGKYLFVQGALS